MIACASLVRDRDGKFLACGTPPQWRLHTGTGRCHEHMHILYCSQHLPPGPVAGMHVTDIRTIEGIYRHDSDSPHPRQRRVAPRE